MKQFITYILCFFFFINLNAQRWSGDDNLTSEITRSGPIKVTNIASLKKLKLGLNSVTTTPDILIEGKGMIATENDLFINIDSDNSSTTAAFTVGKDSPGINNDVELFKIHEDGLTFARRLEIGVNNVDASADISMGGRSLIETDGDLHINIDSDNTTSTNSMFSIRRNKPVLAGSSSVFRIYENGNAYLQAGHYRTYGNGGLYNQTDKSFFYSEDADYYKIRNNKGLQLSTQTNAYRGSIEHTDKYLGLKNKSKQWVFLGGTGGTHMYVAGRARVRNWATRSLWSFYHTASGTNKEQMELTQTSAVANKYSTQLRLKGDGDHNSLDYSAAILFDRRDDDNTNWWITHRGNKDNFGKKSLAFIHEGGGSSAYALRLGFDGNVGIGNEDALQIGKEGARLSVNTMNDQDDIAKFYSGNGHAMVRVIGNSSSVNHDVGIELSAGGTSSSCGSCANYTMVNNGNDFSIVRWHQDAPDGQSGAKGMLRIKNDGTVEVKELKVFPLATPDYVFAEDYDMMPLDEVEQYVELNNHLPGIPSAKEIEDANGYELSKMTMKLLEKIEELTLHTIAQQKEINELKSKMK